MTLNYEVISEVKEKERKLWADWIGNVLTVKFPESKILLWAIAEALERNSFGVAAKPQGDKDDS